MVVLQMKVMCRWCAIWFNGKVECIEVEEVVAVLVVFVVAIKVTRKNCNKAGCDDSVSVSGENEVGACVGCEGNDDVAIDRIGSANMVLEQKKAIKPERSHLCSRIYRSPSQRKTYSYTHTPPLYT